MIVIYWKPFAIICALIPIVLTFCTLYAYRTNEKRTVDDPEKKDFSPHSILLVPFVVPLLLVADIFILILSSLTFGLFLVLFPFALLLFRKPFLIKWMLKQAQKVGNTLLEINTELLRAVGFYPTSIIKFQSE